MKASMRMALARGPAPSCPRAKRKKRTGNEVLALSLLLEACKDHLGALDVLCGVQQVLKQGVVAPRHARRLVGGAVRVALGLPGLAANEAVQVGALLVPRALLHRVALGALGLWQGGGGAGFVCERGVGGARENPTRLCAGSLLRAAAAGGAGASRWCRAEGRAAVASGRQRVQHSLKILALQGREWRAEDKAVQKCVVWSQGALCGGGGGGEKCAHMRGAAGLLLTPWLRHPCCANRVMCAARRARHTNSSLATDCQWPT